MGNWLAGPGVQREDLNGDTHLEVISMYLISETKVGKITLEEHIQSEGGPNLEKLQYLKNKEEQIRKKSKNISEEIKENAMPRVSQKGSVSYM